MLKLQKCGIKGDMLLWTKNFLQGRQKLLVVAFQTGNQSPVESGKVVLGPNLSFVCDNFLLLQVICR